MALVVEPIDVKLRVDCDRIQQLLTNLLSNALKFSPPGGTVWLTAEMQEEPGIREQGTGNREQGTGNREQGRERSQNSTLYPLPSTLHSPTPPLLITVRDQGRGIPADKLHLIFERFQQVDASDARAKGGTGLGLSICRQIVQQHQGQIWAESILGEGSTFKVLLPVGDNTEDGELPICGE